MNKSVRNGLTGIFMSLVTAPAFAQNVEIPPGQQQLSPTLADAICEAAEDHKYIIIGDTNHGSSEIRGAFFNENVISQLASCLPFNTFVFEQPPSQMQYLNDGLAEIERTIEKIERSRDELAEIEAEHARAQESPELRERLENKITSNTFLSQLYQNYADYYEKKTGDLRTNIKLSEKILELTPAIIQNMKTMQDNGFDIRFYDPGYNLNPEDLDIISMLQSAYIDDPKCMNIRLLFSFASGTDTPGQDFARMTELLENRSNDNLVIASSILQNHPDGALIFYGSGHMNGLSDLDELLDDDNSFWINLNETSFSPKSEGTANVEKLMGEWNYERENPDKIFDIETRTVLTPTRDPNNREYTKLSEDEFNSCVDDIPATLRNGFTRNGGNDLTFDDFRWLMDKEREGVPPIFENWIMSPSHP